MFSAKLIPILLTALRCVKGDCFTRSCQKISLDVYRDAIQGLEFVDHVFHNSVTVNPAQCYTWCIQDCRCLSFNFKEKNEEKYCELNEGNHLTNESSLKNSSGTKYYSLRRKYEAKRPDGITSCVGDIICSNGCCRTNPCLNGGTCNEICEPTSVRYNCSCPIQFEGKHCEIQVKKNCQGYKAVGINVSGLYKVIDGNSNQTFQVFCDFDSEPGFAWNLIQSFSLSNKDIFQDLAFYDYNDSNAISGDSPNWQAYLIKRHFLVWLRDHSTHWRATCRYNTDGTVYTDYMRASFKDFDIVRVTPQEAYSCPTYEIVNIRGNECANCTALTWYLKDSYPVHVDNSIKGNCEFEGNKTGDAIPSEDNFGLYVDVNPKFRCSSSSDATTQFWIGGV